MFTLLSNKLHVLRFIEWIMKDNFNSENIIMICLIYSSLLLEGLSRKLFQHNIVCDSSQRSSSQEVRKRGGEGVLVLPRASNLLSWNTACW